MTFGRQYSVKVTPNVTNHIYITYERLIIYNKENPIDLIYIFVVFPNISTAHKEKTLFEPLALCTPIGISKKYKK